jgi:hypothetical protein
LARKQSTRADYSLPDPIVFEDSPLIFPDSNAVIIGDLHCPYHNTTMLVRAVTTGRERGINRLIVAGDIFDFDSLSTYPHIQTESDPTQTIRIGGDVLRYLFGSFNETVIIPGNHDERFAKKLDRSWDMELLINAALGRDWPSGLVYVTDYSYVYLGKDWIVGHPDNYSGQGGQTPSVLADLYQRNVVTLHNHVVGMSQSKSGKYLGIDCGHMTDPAYHFYASRRMNKMTRWCSGFVVIEDGFPELFTANWSRWA